MTQHGRPPNEPERSSIRRLSATGDVTTGWHSSMQTTPNKSVGAFLVESVIGMGLFIAILFLLAWIT